MKYPGYAVSHKPLNKIGIEASVIRVTFKLVLQKMGSY